MCVGRINIYWLEERNRIFPIGAESGAGSRQSVAEMPNTHHWPDDICKCGRLYCSTQYCICIMHHNLLGFDI